jgi:hypothetical protein
MTEAPLEAAILQSNPTTGRIDSAQFHSPASSQSVHRLQANVESRTSGINGCDVDGSALIRDGITTSTLTNSQNVLNWQGVSWARRTPE